MVKNTSQINNCNGLIILVPYDAGQEFYSSHTDEVAYLPVYVETKDENLALMAVANKACQSIYVTFSSSSETKQEWKKRKYPGTARKPGLDLPSSYQAYEIPDPGDCFCCASLEDYEVLTVEEFLKRIQSSPDDYVISFLEDNDDLWHEFDHWCVKFLNYSLFTKK
ncbi:hypothetical protein ACEYW6_29965 [Nostoc sp. UIC 10607]|uniref:hypothetical protein n=1 Tax=Nostoc sp. UIC 10607 TaxID=3045935 RepID=UPI00399F4AB0